jgi:hypothetical protein
MSETIANPAPTIRASWIFGILAALLIFVVIASYSSRMASDGTDIDQKRVAERIDILKKQREADEKALSTADWIDQAKGTVRIPIDEALPETITALKAKPVQAGAEIPGMKPAKQPSAPGATSTTSTTSTATPAANTANTGGPTSGTNATPASPTPPTK